MPYKLEVCLLNQELVEERDFPGGPVVRTQHYHCQGPCSIPGQELRSFKPHGTAEKKEKKKKTS